MFKKLSSIALLLFIGSSFAFTAISLPDLFTKLMERSKMSFTAPEGYSETKIISNGQMSYEYAIKHNTQNFEVRYAIRPLDEELKDYNKWQKNKGPNDIRIHPNKMYEAVFQATVLNVSGGELPQWDEFPPQAVKHEFNADWGAVVVTTAGEEFGQKYKYCMTVALHKDDVGDAYYFYLYDDTKVMDDLMMTAFHSLRFK